MNLKELCYLSLIICFVCTIFVIGGLHPDKRTVFFLTTYTKTLVIICNIPVFISGCKKMILNKKIETKEILIFLIINMINIYILTSLSDEGI